jgi:hypothetical protein
MQIDRARPENRNLVACDKSALSLREIFSCIRKEAIYGLELGVQASPHRCAGGAPVAGQAKLAVAEE